jgi:hypothetical protein
LNLEPYRREEWQLLNFFVENGIGVHRMFTRYWIEGIFCARAAMPSRKSAIYLPSVQTSTAPLARGRKCSLPAWHSRSAVPLGRVASEPMLLQVAGPYGQLASQGILLV